jgi:Crp-like helix-turn-helix domain
MEMPAEERIALGPGPEPFRLLEPFEGIPPHQSNALDHLFPAVLWHAGDDCPTDDDAELVIVRGGLLVAMAPTARGREVAVALLEPGDAYPSLRTDGACRFEPLDHAWLSTVSEAQLDALVRRAPHVGVRIVRALAMQLEEAARAAGVLSEMRVEDRLMGLFHRLSFRHGVVTSAGVRLTLRLSHSGWGTLVGASREAVTAALIRLRRRGVLECRGRDVILPRSALAEYVDPVPLTAVGAD